MSNSTSSEDNSRKSTTDAHHNNKHSPLNSKRENRFSSSHLSSFPSARASVRDNLGTKQSDLSDSSFTNDLSLVTTSSLRSEIKEVSGILPADSYPLIDSPFSELIVDDNNSLSFSAEPRRQKDSGIHLDSLLDTPPPVRGGRDFEESTRNVTGGNPFLIRAPRIRPATRASRLLLDGKRTNEAPRERLKERRESAPSSTPRESSRFKNEKGREPKHTLSVTETPESQSMNDNKRQKMKSKFLAERIRRFSKTGHLRPNDSRWAVSSSTPANMFWPAAQKSLKVFSASSSTSSYYDPSLSLGIRGDQTSGSRTPLTPGSISGDMGIYKRPKMSLLGRKLNRMGFFVTEAVHESNIEDSRADEESKIEVSRNQQLIPARPPQLKLNEEVDDSISRDWRWLTLKCERGFTAKVVKKRSEPNRSVAETLGKYFTIEKFSCFVPRTVLEAIADKRIRYTDDFDIIIECFNAAVVFCDASGFTALTEALDKQENGAEKLGDCINNFFTPLIQIINFWGGDIIKFSGDAVTIVWPVDDDENLPENDLTRIVSNRFKRSSSTRLKREKDDESSSSTPDEPSGFSTSSRFKKGTNKNSSWEAYRIDRTQSCRLACQCCLDLHSNLGNFPTPVPGKFFTLHIGVAFGLVTILQVGGTLDRWEYVVAGPPMQDISIAEPLAASGETVISPTAVEALHGEEGAELEFVTAETGQIFAKLFGLKGQKVSPPPPLENISLAETDVELLRRFIPPPIFKRLTAGYNVFINELRRMSIVFVGVRGLDVSTVRGSHTAHKLMQFAQKAAYTMEGSVNKFLVDDKGVLILVFFGLPPVYHLDDAARAVMTALRIVDGLKTLGLTAGIGVATGRVWVGTVGCDIRKEYTALGDTVNLSARLMGKAADNEINCDEETKYQCQNIIEWQTLPPVRMKGKEHPVAMYRPINLELGPSEIPGNSEIMTWSKWRYKKMLRDIFFPRKKFRQPILGADKPILDYPISFGPVMPWELSEPWSPALRNVVDLGGVMVIKGKEVDGTVELARYLKTLGNALDRHVFLCSNMPDSAVVNISNVPMLAWRKLCTEVVERWRSSPVRERKGFSVLGRDNSVYGVAKELMHPIFHWQLHDMKGVIHGLVLPQDLPDNLPPTKFIRRPRDAGPEITGAFDSQLSSKPFSQSVTDPKSVKWMQKLRGMFRRSSTMETDTISQIPLAYAAREQVAEMQKLIQDEQDAWTFDAALQKGDEDADTNSALAPAICSLLTGYSMYEPCIVAIHIRSGTSLYGGMDEESWKVLLLVGNMAMMRRRRKIELDTQDLKRWRKRHSRNCAFCKGIRQPYRSLDGKLIRPKWSTRCRPPPSQYFPPFILVVFTTDANDKKKEQIDLIKWAQESSVLVRLEKMVPIETASLAAHCLQVPRRCLPNELIEYIHRVSAGIPHYSVLTARQLVLQKALQFCKSASSSCSSGGGDYEISRRGGSNTLRDADGKSLIDLTEKHRKSVLLRIELPGTDGESRKTSGKEKSSSFSSDAEDDTSSESFWEEEIERAETRPDSEVEGDHNHNAMKKWRVATVVGPGAGGLYPGLRSERRLLAATSGNAVVYGFAREEARLLNLKLYNYRQQLIYKRNYWIEKKKPSLQSNEYVNKLAFDENQSEYFCLDEIELRMRSSDCPIYNNSFAPYQLIEEQGKVKRPGLGDEAFSMDDDDSDSMLSTLTNDNSLGTTPMEKNIGEIKKTKHRWNCQVDRDGVRLPLEATAFQGYSTPPGPTEYIAAESSSFVLQKLLPRALGDADSLLPSKRPKLPKTRYDKHQNVIVNVAQDLRWIPYVPQLRAAAMSLIEGLEPDEQLAAKVASSFSVPFAFYELKAVYPRSMLPHKFEMMVNVLIQRELLETCEPSIDDLDGEELLDLLREDGLADGYMSESGRATQAALNSTLGDRTAHLNSNNGHDNNNNVIINPHRQSTMQVHNPHNVELDKRASMQSRKSVNDDDSAHGGVETDKVTRTTTNAPFKELKLDGGQWRVAQSEEGRLARDNMSGVEGGGDTPIEGASHQLKLEPMFQADRPMSLSSNDFEFDDGSAREEQPAIDVSHPPAKLNAASNFSPSWTQPDEVRGDNDARMYGMDSSGRPLFYRFTSISFQHVVADLFPTDERTFFAAIARRVIAIRKFYGIDFLISKVVTRDQTSQENTSGPVPNDSLGQTKIWRAQSNVEQK